MKKFIALVFIAPLLAACATPKTVLRNESTGQVVICGGSTTGSLAGGVIGYHAQKATDAECVADYQKEGFKVQSQIATESN